MMMRFSKEVMVMTKTTTMAVTTTLILIMMLMMMMIMMMVTVAMMMKMTVFTQGSGPGRLPLVTLAHSLLVACVTSSRTLYDVSLLTCEE